MDKVIRKYDSFEAMKDDEQREWQQMTAAERMQAVVELTLALYQIKDPAAHVGRLERTLVHLQYPEG